jgi:hypothetical protein
MGADLTSGDHFAEVNPGRSALPRFAATRVQPTFCRHTDSVFIVDGTDQVVNAVGAVVASGKKLAVRSGGHCVVWRGLSTIRPSSA